MVTPTSHTIAPGTRHFGDFRNMFQPNVEDQKKS